MWNCTISGDASASDYKGYAPIYDNIVSFLLCHERAPATYVDLIEENRALFINSTNAYFKTSLVEPRELLCLINLLDLSSHLYWTPRPFKRSGSVEKDFLFYCQNDDAVACIFCGSRCRYVRNHSLEDMVESLAHGQGQRSVPSERQRVPVSQRVPVRIAHYYYERLDPYYCIPSAHQTTDSNPEVEQPKVRVVESKYFHFQDCPLVWLEQNCQWKHKRSRCPAISPSKFYYAVQMLQYRNMMKTEIEWNSYIDRVTGTTVMGACELTLSRLFSKVIEMKLRCGNTRQLNIFQHPLYAFRYNKPTKGDGPATEDDNQQLNVANADAECAKNYLDHILSTGTNPNTFSMNVPYLIFAIEAECAWKTLVMHGFCVQDRIKPSLCYYQANGDFSYIPPSGYTINATFKLPPIEMVCVYCGGMFDGKLCEPDLIQQQYTGQSQRLILEYLLNTVSFPLPRVTLNCKWNFWDRSPSAESAMAYTVEEVLSSVELNERIAQKKANSTLSHREKILLWLSTSINLSHSPLCIFRYKRPVYAADKCPVCMDDIRTSISLFNCGHTMCVTCANDVRITHCPVCKVGTRKYRLAVHGNREQFV